MVELDIELDKVVKGLKICSPDSCTKERRAQCPYYDGPETDFWSNPDGYMCDYNLRHDAIDLLNAQAKTITSLKNLLNLELTQSRKE